MQQKYREFQIADLTREQKYSYHGARKMGIVISQVCGILGILIFNCIGVGIATIAVNTIPFPAQVDLLNNPMLTLICFSLWFIGVSWLIGSLMINYFPTISVKEDGLAISHYIFFRISIPWSEIVTVIDRKGLFTDVTIVSAKRISLFHRIANWCYFHYPDPYFIIGKDIEDREKLLATIRSKALLHSIYYKPL